MATPPLFTRALLALALTAGFTRALAQTALPPEPISLHTATAFHPLSPNWKLAGSLAGDPRREKPLTGTEGTGILVCNPGKEKADRGHLLTAWEHGDLELDLEFLLTPGSNSGVYLQGRYEVQLFDSWGVREPKSSDCGGLYIRYDTARGKGNEGYEGTAPRANAARAPGLWQKLHIEFEAPRFDTAGKKTRKARFVRVVLNGYTIHENVEVTGPTRSALPGEEAPLGPLMIQGDHGAVAIRGLAVKRFDASAAIAVSDLHYKLYSGDFKSVSAYETRPPTSEGTPARFAHTAVEKSGKFALTFTGTLDVPRAGAYRFELQSGSMSRLALDGRDVVLPLERGSQPGIVTLTAGRHPFRLDLVHTANGRPSLELVAEGPGIASKTLTVRGDDTANANRKKSTTIASATAPKQPRQLLVPVKDRTVVQRGFVPFDPRKRLYAASVGTPAGVHYAYDFEAGTLLRAWRGGFVDTLPMWDGRGNDQTAKPAGPALTFNAKPSVALIEYAADGDWPDQPDALFSSQGYVLEADGQPVFLSTLSDLSIRDRIAPVAEGRGLTRTLQFKGRLPSWSTWVLLAEADTITRQPDGSGWIVGDREWYIDWPAGAPRQPVLRTVAGRQQLAVPLTGSTLEQPVTYSLVW
ncbi:MAG: family 16 glycoside hydrolase [Verrucomicrobiota bacterium]